MQFLNKILKRGGGGATGQSLGAAALTPALLGMLGGGGGLQGLLGKFQSAGLADRAKSWVSTGPNEPATGDEVRQALGDEQVSALAKEAGMSTEEASDHLSSMIPDVVNKLTPDGEVPDENKLQQLLGSMHDKLPGLKP